MLQQKIISAVGWSAAIKLGFQLLTWAMTLVVIRILSPNDYGLMAISQIFINVMTGLANVGLADALVQREDVPRQTAASIFGVLLAVQLAMMAGLFLAAYPIAHWYHDERLVPLIQVSSLGFLTSALTTIPRAYLSKTLNVRPVFVVEMASGLASGVVVIVLAYLGYGVWALMNGWLASQVIRMIAFFAVAREHYFMPRFAFREVTPFLSYGAYRTLDYLVWVVYTSADTLIIGRLLGTANLGLYAVAMNFAFMPLSKIAPIINSVAFPAFALVQTNPSEARFYATKAMRMMATLAIPVFFGVAAISPEVVDLIFGPKWAAAEPMLRILALAVSFRAIVIVVPNYLQGIGDARAGFWCNAWGLVIFPPLIVAGCLTGGIVGACYAWLAGYPVLFAITAWIAHRAGGLDFRQILLLPGPPILAGVAMILAISAARPLLEGTMPEAARLAILVLLGAAVYAGVLRVGFRARLDEIVSLARRRNGATA